MNLDLKRLKRGSMRDFKAFWRWIWRNSLKFITPTLVLLGIVSNLDGTRNFISSFHFSAPLSDIISFTSISIDILLSLLILIISFLNSIYKRQLKSERKCEEEFRLLSHQNYLCDVTHITILFELIALHSTDISNLDKIDRAIRQNIQSLLDHASSIFQDFTGEKCACSIRIFAVSGSIITSHNLFRDGNSAMYRSSVTGSNFNISDNTANVTLINQKKKFYASNDLVAEKNAGRYVNNRPGWEKDYNSTIVHHIPYHDNSLRALPCPGSFCVDSLKGKLDNASCINYAGELSWRIAVLAYSQGQIESCIELLKAKTVP